VVVALHLWVGAALWHHRRLESIQREDLTTVLVTLLPEHRDPVPAAKGFAFTLAPEWLNLTTPPTLEQPLVSDPEEQARVDWDESARRVASTVASTMAAEVKRGKVADTPDRSPPQFAWDLSRTQRWELAPEGGTVVRLNDRCQIIFTPLPIGGCALGKIEARGDLFEDMKSARDER
jgi:hypothetical protein